MLEAFLVHEEYHGVLGPAARYWLLCDGQRILLGSVPAGEPERAFVLGVRQALAVVAKLEQEGRVKPSRVTRLPSPGLA